MELLDYLRPLRKWWWLIVAATLVAVVSSTIATRRQPPIYQTRATLMVGSAITNPNPNGNEFWLTQQLASTYADMVKRAPVQHATMQALGLNWLPEYTVRVVPNTQLVELTVVDTSPERVQAVANELAQQLILQTPTQTDPDRQQRQAFIAQQLNELETAIQSTKEEIDRKQVDLANMLSARQIADAQIQIQGLQNKFTTLQANYAALLANTEKGAINTLSVIETAALPERPVGPNRTLTILLAAVIGFILAASAAYLLEYLDDTLKTAEDVQKALSLTTLSAVPMIEETEAQDELFVAHQSRGAGPEAFRVLRTNLQFAAVDKPLKQILITSAGPSEGKSIITSNLGAAIARADQQVLLVDADLHKPRLHKIFKLPNSIGLTTALLEPEPDLRYLFQETSIPGLRVLTSGPLPPNPAELLGSERMRALIANLSTQVDVLVLDSPPAAMLADATILSTAVDGVVLVIDAGTSRREVVKRAVNALRQVNARIVGVVLNRVSASNGGYYYYYYYGGRYYKDYYSSDGDEAGKKTGRRRGPSRTKKVRGTGASSPLPGPVTTAVEERR